LYSDVDVDSQLHGNVLIVDNSQICDSVNLQVETVYDYTVVFPDASEPSPTNGGFDNQEQFREEALKSLLQKSHLSPTLIAKPSNTRLRDYEGHNLQKAFPLQFPFGIGDITKKNPKAKCPSQVDCYRWLLQLSLLPNMHRPDFVLIVHNMYERHRAMSASWLRAKSSFSTSNYGEIFADIDKGKLHQTASRIQNKGTNFSFKHE
jgi:hypothetical protein